MSELTYKQAGVDIEEGDRFVDLIAPIARKTFRKEVIADIGSFGALFKIDTAKYKEPVLVSGTDGVGTKLKVAFMTNKHDTVGIDLVAMCVNDILTSGAEPLFFLDYFATGKLHAEAQVDVVRGIARGCEQAGCALIGGETAEMPGFYQNGEYDLAGFAVGVVERSEVINGSQVREGDVIIGLASSGFHSNGYSLVRKVFFDHAGLNVDSVIPELDIKLGDILIEPTKIYVKGVLEIIRSGIAINGMAHITGGGIPGNMPRCIPKGLRAEIKDGSWPVPPIFEILKKTGNVPIGDMRQTFNMGIGYAIVTAEGNVKKILDILDRTGYYCYIIGSVKQSVESSEGVDYV